MHQSMHQQSIVENEPELVFQNSQRSVHEVVARSTHASMMSMELFAGGRCEQSSEANFKQLDALLNDIQGEKSVM